VTPPPLHELLAALARRLLERLRREDGSWLSLRVRDDGRLLLRLPVAGWPGDEETAELRAALGAGASERVERPGGEAVELLLDLGERTAEFQTPEVLLALRAEAAAVPGVSFRIELPAGVRDVQRARAGLDSRPR
jgi:hypothetical protein